jgi:DNA-binding transcriptional ArsR family regulator
VLDKRVLRDGVLRALADSRRRAILRLVRHTELASGDTAAQFPEVTGPAISQHLRVLREAELLSERRSGMRRLYRARPEGLRELRQWLREFWSDALEDVKSAAEDDIQPRSFVHGRTAVSSGLPVRGRRWTRTGCC